MRILSWNVNGIRAAVRKGFLDWLKGRPADMICLQETRAEYGQLSEEILHPAGYESVWSDLPRKGYAGVGVYTKSAPRRVITDFSHDNFDTEYRFLELEFGDIILMNIYFPNGGSSPERLKYKLKFYDRFLDYLRSRQGEKIVICGDINTAHRPADLARPESNALTSGFLPEEREWIDRLIDAGLTDTFRYLHPDEVKYSWWDYKTRSRERNIGWRIDYFFVSENMLPAVSEAFIMNEVPGSDHCPVGIDIELP